MGAYHFLGGRNGRRTEKGEVFYLSCLMWSPHYPDTKATEGAISELTVTLSTLFCDCTKETDNSVTVSGALWGKIQTNKVLTHHTVFRRAVIL